MRSKAIKNQLKKYHKAPNCKTCKGALQNSYRTDDDSCMWIRIVWMGKGQRVSVTAKEQKTISFTQTQKTPVYKGKTTIYTGDLYKGKNDQESRQAVLQQGTHSYNGSLDHEQK